MKLIEVLPWELEVGDVVARQYAPDEYACVLVLKVWDLGDVDEDGSAHVDFAWRTETDGLDHEMVLLDQGQRVIIVHN